MEWQSKKIMQVTLIGPHWVLPSVRSLSFNKTEAIETLQIDTLQEKDHVQLLRRVCISMVLG